MYSAPVLAIKYLRHLLGSKGLRGHGIHSPFVFSLVTEVLADAGDYYCYGPVESVRNAMLRDKRVLDVEDFGAGSRTGATKRRGVSQIAHSALKPQKFGQLLFRLANYYQCKTIVELGTSLGITTCYLASARSSAKVYTIEGASAIAAVASQNISWLGLKNVEQVTGNFDDTLPPLLNRLGMVDLVYIDGNHRKEPTLRYFHMLRQLAHHQTMLVFDDIHWSREMEDAWEQIRQHESVTLSVDLFFLGIIFFNPAFLAKQHFRIRY